VRSIPAGAVVGYNGTFVATEPMRLALLAVGYADGLDRRLGNRFSLFGARGQRAPAGGSASAWTRRCSDVTEIPEVSSGDEVVILGTQGSKTITAFDHAEAAGRFPGRFSRVSGSAWRGCSLAAISHGADRVAYGVFAALL